MKPTISVVLATFNGGLFIKEQLESIRAQTLLPSELLIFDDGSTDNTLDIARSFAESVAFPTTIYADGDHVGWADNFIRAIAHAQCDAVAFCDQDDIWRHDKLELQATAMEADEKISLVTHAWETLGGASRSSCVSGPFRSLGRVRQGEAAKLPAIGVPGMTMMLRADVVQKVVQLWPGAANKEKMRRHGFSILPHDLFAIDVAIGLGDIVSLSQPLVAYRAHGRNVYNRPENRTPRVNWSRRHSAVRSWQISSIRLNEWCNLYYEVLQKRPGASIYSSLAARAEDYECRSKGYAARADVYLGASLRPRLSALRYLVGGGYRHIGKRSGAVVAAALRDIIGVAGWR